MKLPAKAAIIEVLLRDGLQTRPGRSPCPLIPNLRGYRAGREAGLAHLNFVFSTSEKHNLNNVNKTIRESLTELRAIAAQAERDGIGLRISIATAFGCPLEGEVPPARVLELIGEVLACPAIEEIVLADTAGLGSPPQVFELKELENQAGRPLVGYRSVYVDNRSLRIIWKVTELQVIEVAIIAGIAEREGMFAYKLVSRRRGELEKFIKELVKQ
ncbi:MAG: hypothetical protein K6U04_02265 [Armatimonadetes bacterium]|nr:hypothetical protein [Armatimonadota bacterium]